MQREIALLREALMDITGLLNRPQPDTVLLGLAKVDLDRALFPILVRLEHRGPVAIGELAEISGRDYTTISRQVTKLETLGLATRRPSVKDARIKEVTVTEKGRAVTNALDGARERLVASMLAAWDQREVAELARLLRKLADDALEVTRSEKLPIE